MTLPFCKFHGFGNDYIVLERSNFAGGLGNLAKAICHRNTGVGGDGIAVLERLVAGTDETSDYFCEIVNPDGSIASFSGNGTRCAAAYLYYKDLWHEPRLRLKTHSGVKNYELLERIGDGEFWFEAEIGKPKFKDAEIPVLTDDPCAAVVNEPITIDDRQFSFSAVNIGNPVVCVYVENFDFDWRYLGRTLETQDKFPDRANIVFVKIIDRGNIEIRIWERGAGETSASGTCSSGAAILSAFMLKTDRKVAVKSPGGTTDILWRDDDEIIIKGRANLVFSGEWPV